MASEATHGSDGGANGTVPEVAVDPPVVEASGSGSSAAATDGPPESAAARMQRLHNAHAATVEDVVDEEDLLHPGSRSGIATGQATPVIDGPLTSPSPAPTAAAKKPVFDIHSAELFPELGAPGPGKGKGKGTGPAAPPTWGAKNGGASGASIVGSSSVPAAQQVPKTTLPLMSQEVTETMNIDKADQIPRDQLKKPLADALRSIMKETGTRIQASSSSTGMLTLITKGKADAVQRAKALLRREVCRKTQSKMSIPVSTRKHIIGLKGATIQGITQRTGCRVQIPQVEETETVDDPFAEEEPMVEITLEGDHDGILLAKQEINQIVGQKTSHVNIKLPFAQFPGQFFPFLAGPHNAHVTEMEEGKDLKIRIPMYHTSETSKEFSEPPVPIMLSGEKNAVHEARAKLEKHAAQLRDEFQSISINIPKPQHRFLIGDRGKAIGEILLESGCSVVLPPAHIQTNSVLVIGPRHQIGNGVTTVMNKANSMSLETLDISRAHATAFANEQALQRQHARDLARYFRKIKEIQRIESECDVQISLPKTDVLYDPSTGVIFEIVGKEQENVKKAKSSVINIVNAHPPSRVGYTDIEPLLHRHIIGAKGRNLQKIKDDHGVEILFADEDDQDSQVVLVYEGPSGTQSMADAALAAAALQTVTELLQKAASEQADLKTKVLNIPAKYHARIVGPKGTTLNAFTGGSDATVKVIVGAPKLKPGQPPLTPAQAAAADDSITIRGPSAEVERVAAKIIAFVEDTKHNEVLNSYTVTFDFPQKFQKNLVGKGGSNISKYRDELGVQIDLEKDTVTIKGIKANVEEAKVRIQRLGRKLEDETTTSINVAPEYHRTIIGQGGKFVKRLEDKYSVRIQFPKTGRDEPASDMASDAGGPSQRSQAPNEIVLRGPSKGVKEAKDEITELIKYEQEHGHSASLTVPAKVLPYIIGAGGKVINQIRDDTGAKIDLPPHGSTDAEMVEVKIRGTKDQVAKAKAAIQANSKEVESQVVRMLNVDKKFHRALIGPGGQILNAIVAKAGGPTDRSLQARMVRFPHQDASDNNIKVEGNAAVVDKIIEQLEAIVEVEKNKVTIVVDIPAEKHRKLIGREGSVRKEIERMFSVSLDIPRQRQGGEETPAPTGVKLSGTEAAVEKAKEHILKLTKDQEVMKVPVPVYLHHSLADNGTLARQFRNKYNVDLGFHGEQPPKPKGQQGRKRADASGSLPLITDDPESSAANYSWEVVDHADTAADATGKEVTWILRGSTEETAKAVAELQQLIEGESDKTTTGYLFLPDPSKYRYVVGPGGSQVNSIRKETGCKITIPKEQSDEAIVIKGSKDGVESAKEIILGLVQGGRSNGGGRRSGQSSLD
ncbi:Vigilin [Drechslerella dactyloides]|uniref:Vigilin n=1 Tax=Drechslerella dactyloides TaxID=74499 RepID=A0AAD6IPT5_DREDA|nr:Vigilin [Drechslerella dactyloides]